MNKKFCSETGCPLISKCPLARTGKTCEIHALDAGFGPEHTEIRGKILTGTGGLLIVQARSCPDKKYDSPRRPRNSPTSSRKKHKGTSCKGHREFEIIHGGKSRHSPNRPK